MKCISLWQPWASLIFGRFVPGIFKRWETRSWATKYRGLLLIHAARKRMVPGELREILYSMGLQDHAARYYELPRGYILGQVDLVDCLRTEDSNWELSDQDLLFGDFRDGRFAWKLENPVMFGRPIQWKGSQGFFEVPESELPGGEG